MKSKTLFKMILDAVLLVLYLQLMFCYDLSPLFHEVMGMGIGVLFIIHVAVNWKPVKAMMAKSREGKLSASRHLLLASDLILPFCMLGSIVSGMLIATEVWLGPGDYTVVLFHTAVSYTALAILAAHTLLHARYLAGYMKQMMRGDGFQRVINCLGAASLVFALYGANLMTGLKDGSVSLTSACSTTSVDGDTATSAFDTADVSDTSATTTAAAGTTTAATEESTSKQASYATTSTTTAASSDTSTSVSSGSSDSATEDSTSTPSNCSLCGKHCPITNLRCNRGTSWAQQNGYI